MKPEMRQTFERDLSQWRCELKHLGARLDHAQHPHEVEVVVTAVRDLQVRVRRVCDELNVAHYSDDSLNGLIRKINERLDRD